MDSKDASIYNNIANISEKPVIHTLKELLDYVSEEDIFAYYLGSCNINTKYKSPFKEENTPSFCLFYTNNGLRFKCFASGNYGDCFNFVSMYYNITIQQTINKIISDVLNNKVVTIQKKENATIKKITTKNIFIITQEFNTIDTQYWLQFNISIDILKTFNVYACKEVWLNGIRTSKYKTDNPIYAYLINGRYKIYSPYKDKNNFKFISNTNDKCIQGFKQLKYNTNTIYITSSLKDVMTLYSIGIESIALSSETASVKIELINYLKSRYEKVIIFYNNDSAGLTQADLVSKTFNIPYIYTPLEGPKDPSDFVKLYGINKLKLWLQN